MCGHDKSGSLDRSRAKCFDHLLVKLSTQRVTRRQAAADIFPVRIPEPAEARGRCCNRHR
jgi:hypothetical protein